MTAPHADERPCWTILFTLLIFGALLRVALFNGPFGSDDVLYLRRAVEVSNGVWSSADYNGGLRYGFNIPAGLSIHLFGLSAFTVTLWPLLCSVAEIGAVYLFAERLWGRRPALYSALILTFMPLHIALATRLNPDPVVSFFLTLSFMLFYFAERSRGRALYVLTGAAMGMIFWAKELAVVTFIALALYPIVWRKLDKRWGYVIAGGIPLLAAHLGLMKLIAGDPLHAFKVVAGQVNRSFIQAGVGEDSVWYYFRYLYFDIKHTWLAPWAATIAALTFGWEYVRFRKVREPTAYAVFWAISLLAVLSFVPVSLAPVRFALKQSNYLSLFLAPVALLAGYQAARAPFQIARPFLVLIVTGGLVLGVLEQQAIRVFTSNGKAAVEFARARPDAQFFGSVNNSNMARAYSLLTHDPSLAERFVGLDEVSTSGYGGNRVRVFVVIDKETMSWGSKALSVERIPSCWKEVQILTPTGFGRGHVVIRGLLSFAETLPPSVRNRVVAPIRRLSEPQPAAVYQVDPSEFWCRARNM